MHTALAASSIVSYSTKACSCHRGKKNIILVGHKWAKGVSPYEKTDEKRDEKYNVLFYPLSEVSLTLQ